MSGPIPTPCHTRLVDLREGALAQGLHHLKVIEPHACLPLSIQSIAAEAAVCDGHEEADGTGRVAAAAVCLGLSTCVWFCVGSI